MRTLALAVALSIAATTASAMDVWEQKWIEVHTAHYVILSAVQQKRTLELAHELESFRAALGVLMNTGPVQDRVPTKIYLLPSGVKGLGNFFAGHVPSMRANYVAIINSELGLEVFARNQIGHVQILNSALFGHPAWFDEGVAKVFETATVDGNMVEYGKPSGFWKRTSWGWITLDDLLHTRDFSKLSRYTAFDNQSWALVHYLMYARPDRRFDNDSGGFFEMIQDGATQTEAFEHAFDVQLSPLDTQLSKYVSGRIKYYRTSFTDGAADVQITVVPAPADSIAAQLGEFLAVAGARDAAKYYWDAAIVLNPNNVQALIGLGDLHKFAGRFEDALPYYERAIALEPQNAYHELDYGEFFLDRARASSNPATVASDLTEARKHFARSSALNPNIPETFAMNGSSYLFRGESIDEALEALTAAHTMLPTHPRINVLLAAAYLRSGDRAAAERLLRLLVIQLDNGAVRDAEKLLQEITPQPTNEGASASH